MKRIACTTALIMFAACVASAQGKGFGLGVILGEPTGVSAKGWLSPRAALDAGFAWSLREDGFLHAHMDYLWHFSDVINTAQQVFPYVGIGGRIVGHKNSAIAGVRIPAGIAWWPGGAPIDVFFEVAPVVDVAPETDLSVNGGLGIRFFFR